MNQAREERKRYTTQSQRRAQAPDPPPNSADPRSTGHGTPGDHGSNMPSKRPGARRVSFYRPVERGRRWHVATMLADGSFYSVSPVRTPWDGPGLPRTAPIAGDRRGRRPSGRRTDTLGTRHALVIGVPVLWPSDRWPCSRGGYPGAGNPRGIFNPSWRRLSAGLPSVLTTRASNSNRRRASRFGGAGTQCRFSCRSGPAPAVEVDETFEVTPGELAVLNFASGDRGSGQFQRSRRYP